jgi:hypothetical protein
MHRTAFVLVLLVSTVAMLAVVAPGPVIIALLQAEIALPTLVQAHTRLGSAMRAEAMPMSPQSALVSSAPPAGTQTWTEASRADSQQSGQPASSSIDAPLHLSHVLPVLSVQHTCPILDPPVCSTTLTAIRDSHNCVTGYLCAPAAITLAADPSPKKRSTGASCTYNGRTYEPGATIRVPGPWCSGCVVSLLVVVTCTNGQWLTVRGDVMPQ